MRCPWAETASNVLHDVGNVLNTVYLAIDLMKEEKEDRQVDKLAQLMTIFNENVNEVSSIFNSMEESNFIKQYVPLLMSDFEKNSEAEDNTLNLISENLATIRNIIIFHQQNSKKAPPVERFSLRSFVDSFLELQSVRFFEHQINVHRDFDDVCEVVSDKNSLLMILTNFVTNSIDSLVESGKPKKMIDVSMKDADDYVVFKFRDNGVGMPKEVLDHVFQHGFSTKSSGNGFGLHSAASTVNQLGGKLSAQSDGLNQGAEFTLTLPKRCVKKKV